MNRATTRRGNIAFALAPVLLLLGTMTTLLSLRSMEIYRNGAQAKWHMQAQAAAEGAAVALEASDMQIAEPLTIGHARVTCSPSDSSPSPSVDLRVEVLGKDGNVLLTKLYIAHFTPLEVRPGRWNLAGIEARR